MQDILNKILSNEKAAEKSEYLKKQGEKIVLVNGVFDLLHIGHIGFLRRAKERGDVLLVAVTGWIIGFVGGSLYNMMDKGMSK